MKRVCVMSGGGAKGAIQVGMLWEAYRQGMDFDAFYGTSVGALNAAGISILGIRNLVRVWSDVRKRSDVLTAQPSFITRLLWGWGKIAPYHHRKVMDWLPMAQVQAYPRKFVVAYTDLYTGQVLYADSHKMPSTPLSIQDAVLASSAFPGVMEPVQGRYADGGLREITPIQYAIEDNPGDVELWVLLAYPRSLVPIDYIKNVVQYASRSLNVTVNEVAEGDIRIRCKHPGVTLHLVMPTAEVLDSFDFNPSAITAGVNHGMVVMAKYLKGIK